jgi:hypothetical protein
MSQASIELVREFFIINDFFVLKKEDLLLVKNSGAADEQKPGGFILSAGEIGSTIGNAVVKPISWHTMKFTPAVLKKFPEVFDFLGEKNTEEYKRFFKEESFLKVLVIPSLPASENLREESIRVMKEKGVNNLIIFSSIIAGLVEKIDARHVYLSSINEVLRVLKFYKFFKEKEEEQNLPF